MELWLMITNTSQENWEGRVKVHSHGGQWRRIAMFTHSLPWPIIRMVNLSDKITSIITSNYLRNCLHLFWKDEKSLFYTPFLTVYLTCPCWQSVAGHSFLAQIVDWNILVTFQSSWYPWQLLVWWVWLYWHLVACEHLFPLVYAIRVYGRRAAGFWKSCILSHRTWSMKGKKKIWKQGINR